MPVRLLIEGTVTSSPALMAKRTKQVRAVLNVLNETSIALNEFVNESNIALSESSIAPCSIIISIYTNVCSCKG